MSGVDGLQRLSLLVVLAGLSTIYVGSAVFTPERVTVRSIGEDDIGSTVRVTGTVTDRSTTEDAEFFDLQGETGSIRAVHFGSGLPVEEGTAYTIEGRVDIYQGELEIVADNVVSGPSSPPHPG